MTTLAENLDRLEDEIAAACRQSGRNRSEVELMAVSKTYPAATLLEAQALGLNLFGENRVQEFQNKAESITELRAANSANSTSPANSPSPANAASLRVHLIGHLQSNKAARAAELFDGIDSVDSLRLAERLNEAAGKLNQRLPILLEVKLSREETKAGLDPESSEAAALLERLPDFAHLQALGLMTIAPWGVAEDITRACFRSLRTWRDRWSAAHPHLNLTSSPWA